MEINKPEIAKGIKNSITLRMVMVGFLSLMLLIPLFFIQELIKERSRTKDIMIRQTNQEWGGPITLYGPILEIPYQTFTEKKIKDPKTKKTYTEIIEKVQNAYFFPNALHVNGNADSEEKTRGIYKTTVFSSVFDISGTFGVPDFNDINVDKKHVLWEDAKVIFKTSNLKGVSEQISVSLNNHNYPLTADLKSVYSYPTSPKSLSDTYSKIKLYKLLTKRLALNDVPKNEKIDFKMSLNVNGSEEIQVIPIGKETYASLKSNWKTANFFGEFLPFNSNKISDNGFDAKWKVLNINRPFSQQYAESIPNLISYAFGVNFMVPVNDYLKSERTTKYGILVISLTFLVFFLIQTLSKIGIHPFQYLMIGLALTMFYTLLISISEHSNFLKAYAIAGTAVVLLITLYSRAILKSFKFSTLIFMSLTILYGFIYVIIQLENYALLVGSVGLFIILAVIMFVSNKIDWHGTH